MVPRIAVLVGYVLGNMVGILSLPSLASAVSHTVVISEVQMAGQGSGHSGDEFIELYNASDAPISLEKWTLKYHALSTGDCTAGWITKFTFPKASIASHGFWLVAVTGYLNGADGRYTAGLASTGGAVKLSDATATAVDILGWGNLNTCAEGNASTPAPDGKSLERRPGADVPTGGNAVDTDDNQSDYVIRDVPEPQGSSAPSEEPVVDTPSLPLTYLPLQLSEVYVDPVSPQTDARDEFIELRNTNAEPVQIAGYILATGSASYHLLPQVIAPGGFVAIPSSMSHLSLNNDGGSLKISDPLGNVVDETAPWSKAVPGAAWALFDDGWTWTTTPSPAALNIRADVDTTSAPVDGTGSIPSPIPNPTPAVYPQLSLNEVFPDPSAPLTDAQDEFIELYNPTDQPVSIQGYVLKSGSSLGNSFVLPDASIPAGGYLAFKSADTTVPLANDGSTVALYDPKGTELDSVTYTHAPTGEAWAIDGGTWTWTTTPTPSAHNVISLPTPAPAKSVSPKTATSKAKTTTTKVVAAKVASKKVASKKVSTSSKDGSVLGVSSQPNNNPWLLYILAGLTIIYIIYEFRYDLRNYYQRLKRYSAARR